MCYEMTTRAPVLLCSTLKAWWLQDCIQGPPFDMQTGLHPEWPSQIDNGEADNDASLHSSLSECDGVDDQPCAAIAPSTPSGGSPVVTLHSFDMQTELHPEWPSQIDNGEAGNDASLHSSLSGYHGVDDQPCAAIAPSSPSGGSPVVTLHPLSHLHLAASLKSLVSGQTCSQLHCNYITAIHYSVLTP